MTSDADHGGGSPEDKPPEQPEGDQPARAKADRADHEEQPKDHRSQFADAAGDPLTEAAGGTGGRGAEQQAYRAWARAQASGAAAFFSGGSFGDINIGGKTVFAHDQHAAAAGHVRPEIIENLVLRYVPVSRYESLVKRLESTHLLVLRGAPGTGRATTGLRILADVTSEHVSRFGPDAEISRLSDSDLETGFGYLVELIPGWGSAAAAATNADHLRQQLTKRGCFMVVIIPHDIQYRDAFEDYVADCPLPDPQQVLVQAIEHEMRQRPHLAEALRDLMADLPFDDFGDSWLPSEAWWAAALMASCAMGEITSDEMIGRVGESLSRYVSGWFEPLAQIPASAAADEPVSLATFRIALAVFNQAPFDVVAEAGELLTGKIMTAGSSKREPGRAVFANHRDDYLADSRAQLVPGAILFGKSSAPSVLAEYVDDRMPEAILRHVWDVRNIRRHLLPWLQELSQDSRPFVWIRAALTIGQLCSWDFPSTFHEFIDPWASSPSEEGRRHLVAAVALDAASRNAEVLPVVLEIIGNWCRTGNRDQRWTAATALGYDLGVHDPEASLKNLQVVGSWENGDLALIASWAVARIFSRGAIGPVLIMVDRWLRDDRREVRQLGLRAALRVANLKVADVDDPEAVAGGREWQRLARRDNWPLLAALVAGDRDLLDPFADMVWPVTRSAAFQALSLEVLESWIRAGQRDRTCVGPVGMLLRLLGDDEADRARLLHLIEVLCHDREDPLPSDVADRFIAVIDTSHDAIREEAVT